MRNEKGSSRKAAIDAWPAYVVSMTLSVWLSVQLSVCLAELATATREQPHEPTSGNRGNVAAFSAVSVSTTATAITWQLFTFGSQRLLLSVVSITL